MGTSQARYDTRLFTVMVDTCVYWYGDVAMCWLVEVLTGLLPVGVCVSACLHSRRQRTVT